MTVRDFGGIRKARCSALCALLAACVFIPPANARQTTSSGAGNQSATKSSSGTHTASSKKHSRKRRSPRVRGQKKIDPDRARTIQEALIRQRYLTGEPTGTWNQASEEAMRRYQGDHGWQTKEVPDSRALISLGLGPSKDHLLNPDSAMTTDEKTPAAQPTPAPQNPPAPTPTPASTPTPGDPAKPQ